MNNSEEKEKIMEYKVDICTKYWLHWTVTENIEKRFWEKEV